MSASSMAAMCFAGSKDAEYPGLVRHVLNIDSRDRENYASTTASNFTVKFNGLNNVVSLNLLQAQIPNTEYVINARNNIIDFTDSVAGASVATLTQGSYTATELADEINLQMNTAVGAGFGVEYQVTYITFTQKFRVTNVALNTFSFDWATGPNATTSTWFEFGEATQTDTAAGLSTYDSSATVRLSGDDYINMILTGGHDFSAQQNTSFTQGIFAKIILAAPARSIIFQEQQGSNPKIMNPPLSKLQQLRVSFRHPRQVHRTSYEEEEPLYEFNGHDVSFSIEVLCLSN